MLPVVVQTTTQREDASFWGRLVRFQHQSGREQEVHKLTCERAIALLVQGALGALALLSLVWKRSRENPQRPLLIWFGPLIGPSICLLLTFAVGYYRFFDASKQVWGSVLVHIANLLLSMLSSGQFTTEPTPKSVSRMFRRHGGDDHDSTYHANPCSFYLLNLAIDVRSFYPHHPY